MVLEARAVSPLCKLGSVIQFIAAIAVLNGPGDQLLAILQTKLQEETLALLSGSGYRGIALFGDFLILHATPEHVQNLLLRWRQLLAVKTDVFSDDALLAFVNAANHLRYFSDALRFQKISGHPHVQHVLDKRLSTLG